MGEITKATFMTGRVRKTRSAKTKNTGCRHRFVRTPAAWQPTKVTMMATYQHTHPTAADWMDAKSLLPCARNPQDGPQCALVPDGEEDKDHIAVVYDKGDTPPEITIHEVSGSVHTVCANGVAVAVVASAHRPAPRVDQVLLVERAL